MMTDERVGMLEENITTENVTTKVVLFQLRIKEGLVITFGILGGSFIAVFIVLSVVAFSDIM